MKNNTKIIIGILLSIGLSMIGCKLIVSHNSYLENTNTRIIEVNLRDSNYIYEGKIISFVCEDNVYIAKGNYYFGKIVPFKQDFLYLSTWRDGVVPHSTGKCYIKVREINNDF